MTRILAIAAFLPFFLLYSVSPVHAQATIVTIDEPSADDVVEIEDEHIVIPVPTQPVDETVSDNMEVAT